MFVVLLTGADGRIMEKKGREWGGGTSRANQGSALSKGIEIWTRAQVVEILAPTETYIETCFSFHLLFRPTQEPPSIHHLIPPPSPSSSAPFSVPLVVRPEAFSRMPWTRRALESCVDFDKGSLSQIGLDVEGGSYLVRMKQREEEPSEREREMEVRAMLVMANRWQMKMRRWRDNNGGERGSWGRETVTRMLEVDSGTRP